MSTLPKSCLTPEEYLEIERAAETRSEYFQGEMFAMSGATLVHNRLVWRLSTLLDRALTARGCLGCANEMRVRVGDSTLYTYPDVVVACGELQFLDGCQDTLLNPSLIIEVLSPSTEAYNRGRKFDHYRSIKSLQEYLLISTELQKAELFTRQSPDRWLLTIAEGPAGAIDLQTAGYRLSLTDLYDGIDVLP